MKISLIFLFEERQTKDSFLWGIINVFYNLSMLLIST